MFGINVSDMQSGITIGTNAITGTLKYVSGGWDAGTWSSAESTGNYIALKCEATDDATVTVELVNGVHGPVTLDEDMNVIIRVTDTANQSIKVTASKDGMTTTTNTYSLSGLVLESAS